MRLIVSQSAQCVQVYVLQCIQNTCSIGIHDAYELKRKLEEEKNGKYHFFTLYRLRQSSSIGTNCSTEQISFASNPSYLILSLGSNLIQSARVAIW